MNKLLSFLALSILLLVPIGVQNAFAVPTTLVAVDDLPSCDPLMVPLEVDELGYPQMFPVGERISIIEVLPAAFDFCESELSIGDVSVEIMNDNSISFTDLWFVASPGFLLGNVDGTVTGPDGPGPAFKIDTVGVNRPLLSESLTPDGIFEPGETWTFVISDWTDFSTLTTGDVGFGSIGIASTGGASTASIIAIPTSTPSSNLIGGEIIPIKTTSLLLASANSFSWMIPVTLSILGIGLFVVSRKYEN